MTTAVRSDVLTFLFTDIEGSTRRWEADADAMRDALETCSDECARSAFVLRRVGVQTRCPLHAGRCPQLAAVT
jgi:class 3 adenylate cyclase